MKLNDFLLYSIKHKCYRRKSWIFSLFAITQETEEQKKQTYPGKLIREPFGFYVVLESGEREKIEVDAKPTEPLLRPDYTLTITKDAVPSVKEGSVQTSIGTLLINLICLVEAFGGKFPYKAGKFLPSDLEKEIVAKLESTPKEGEPRKDDIYYVDELLKFQEGVIFIETLSSLFTHSVTRIGLLPAPGRKEFKKELLTRYEGKLHDPVEMSKFEAELANFDKEYLKNDPAYGKFMKGSKILGARTKAYMTQGGETNDFSGELSVTPIVAALEDGIPLDEKGFTAIANTIRYGSFSRGAETVNGGVVAKGLMRSADNWRITEGDCGATLGIRRQYSEVDIGDLVGRYIIEAGKLVLIETKDQAKAYANRRVVVRSPQYCPREGTQTCSVCAGTVLSKYPTGVPIPLMEVSGGILVDSLKKMHSNAVTTATLDLRSTIT